MNRTSAEAVSTHATWPLSAAVAGAARAAPAEKSQGRAAAMIDAKRCMKKRRTRPKQPQCVLDDAFLCNKPTAGLLRPLHGLEHPHEIAARQLFEIGVAPAALHQRGENAGEAGDILQALALRATEKNRADAEMIRADLAAEIIEVVAIFGERAARPRTELAFARGDDLVHVDAARGRTVLVL